jgi:ribosome-binding factor A
MTVLRSDEAVVNDVGVDDRRTELTQNSANARFAAGNSACKTNDFHSSDVPKLSVLDKARRAHYEAQVSEFEHKRSHRVGQLVHEELGRLLLDELKDPRVGFVTVTEVRMADDLRSAKVFVSIYGTTEQRTASLEGLRAAAGFIKRELAQRLKLRSTPELTFHADETLDHAQRLQQIMGAIARGESEAPDPSMMPIVPVSTSRTALAESARTFEAERASRAQRQPTPKRNKRRPAKRR